LKLNGKKDEQKIKYINLDCPFIWMHCGADEGEFGDFLLLVENTKNLDSNILETKTSKLSKKNKFSSHC
jgi:hypothetical protein